MLINLTVQQKIVMMVLVILVGSMATSMIAYVSYQKLQRLAKATGQVLFCQDEYGF